MTSSYTSTNRTFDWVLFSVYLAIVSIGLLMLYATGDDFTKEQTYFWSTDIGRQVIWALISVAFCLSISLIDWKFWNTFSYPAYGIGIALLLALLVFGTEVKGAKSWFTLSSFSLQPTEFAKVSTILGLAAFCSSFKTNLNVFTDQLYAFGLIGIPAGLILLQPDAGSALTFTALSLMLFRNGLPSRYFLVIVALLLAIILSIMFSPSLAFSVILTLSLFFIIDYSKTRILPTLVLVAFVLGIYVGYRFEFIEIVTGIMTIVIVVLIQMNSKQSFWKSQFGTIGVIALIGVFSFAISHTYQNILKPHQKDRINVWLKPENSDPRGSLYNLMQSKMAIGSGGLNGKGFLKGSMTKLNYVPEQKTDFIFSTIGEEQGFIGCTGIIVLFFILLVRILSIGENASVPFPLYFSYGVAGLLFMHIFVNIGMTIGLAPVIGIPLPFISKGGSSLLAFSILIGIVLNMSKKGK
jgi:rod shape determining protein RodA